MFSTRMLFPILFPTFNEKIIIRVWDKRTGLSDIFIAHLPEKWSLTIGLIWITYNKMEASWKTNGLIYIVYEITSLIMGSQKLI